MISDHLLFPYFFNLPTSPKKFMLFKISFFLLYVSCIFVADVVVVIVVVVVVIVVVVVVIMFLPTYYISFLF